MREVVRPCSSVFLRAATLAVAAASLGACTIVRVESERGVRTTYYPGIAIIRIAPTDSVQILDAQTIGAAAVGTQMNLGWSRSRIALVPPGRCQLIVWRIERAQSAAIRDLLGTGTEICDWEGETQ